jgi:prepilin-type N-terminal cleavage/methylation domain-containing protein
MPTRRRLPYSLRFTFCAWPIIFKSVLSPRTDARHSAFTLFELLVVVGIIAILIVLAVPAFTKIKTGSDIATAAYQIAGALEQGRNYAMANNTYVWVGFYEEDMTAAVSSNATPPYPGKGQVLIAGVFSTDGTKIYEDGDPIAQLPPNRIKQLGRLVKIEGIHLTDIGAPSSTPSTAFVDSLDARPSWPYTYASGIGADHFNRINSDSPDATRFAFVAQNYTFSKTVRFNSRGEANLNSTYSLKNAAEIGLKPTHGTVVNNGPNVIAIQFGGVGGNFKIYHR